MDGKARVGSHENQVNAKKDWEPVTHRVAEHDEALNLATQRARVLQNGKTPPGHQEGGRGN
jgi:hypothetical protein